MTIAPEATAGPRTFAVGDRVLFRYQGVDHPGAVLSQINPEWTDCGYHIHFDDTSDYDECNFWQHQLRAEPVNARPVGKTAVRLRPDISAW